MRSGWAGTQLVVDGTRGRGRAAGLARACGVDPSTVTRWERGGRMSPDYWQQAEEFLGLEAGTFAALDQTTTADEVGELRGQVIHLATLVEEIAHRLEAVEVAVRRRA